MISILQTFYKYFYPECIADILFYTIDKGVEKFLNYEELHNISNVNKLINSNYAIKNEIKIKKVYSYFQDTFIPYNILEKSEILNWKDSFIMIDYVDRINIEDLKYPLMITVDRYKRPVLSIKYKYNNSDKYNGILTIFQRYSDDKHCWVKANYKGPFLKMSAMSSLSNNDKEIVIYNINSLLDGKNKIKVNNYQQSYLGDYEFDSNINDYDEVNITI